MAESVRTTILAQFTGTSPLRIAGNLLLAWVLGLIVLVCLTFPGYPQTGTGWLLYVIAGPPAFLAVDLAGQLVLTWISRWLGRKDPELRPWMTILITIALISLVAWGIHSIP